jgi:hypothetical protein
LVLLTLYHSPSFHFFPKFYRVVPLLQTCSIYKVVYDHVCFCVCVYFWICLPPMRENMWHLSFWALLHLTWCSPITSIYIQTTWFHDFLIHSSVVKHLSSFHSLAIINSAAINISVTVSLLYPDLHSFSSCPGVVSLDHMAVLSFM